MQELKPLLIDIPEGEDVIRYGVTIGHAERGLKQGNWVHEGLLRLLTPQAVGRKRSASSGEEVE